jgi:hypothetical protein
MIRKFPHQKTKVMGMYGRNIQRAKIEIDRKVTEQLSALFTYETGFQN